MKAAAIRAAVKADPQVTFAVKLPRFQYGRRTGTDTAQCRIDIGEHKSGPLNVRRTYPPMSDEVVQVPLSAVLAPWDAYVLDRDWDEAIQADRSRDDRLRYERKRQERKARIEAWLPAFEKLMVPAEGLSTANVERPDVDLMDELRRSYVDGDASATMVGWTVWERVAQRILTLQSLVEQQAADYAVAEGREPAEDPLAALEAAAMEAARQDGLV